MKDERIQAAINRFAAIGFAVWYVLMLLSIYYRMLVLKQSIGEFWDIVAIFFIGTLYVSIAFARNGVIAPGFYKKRALIIGPTISVIIGFLIFQHVAGRTLSVVEVGAFLIGFLPAMGLGIGILYFLTRRWKRREGIEEEE